MIELENVRKVFNQGKENEYEALRGVSLRINSGECVVLRGPSGSGKTTLLSIIGCISPPTSGKVVILGKEVSKLPEKFLTLFRREHIGIIFQQFNLINDLTAIENVVLPLLPAGIKPEEGYKRAREILKKLNLHDKADFKVKELSGGEQQRVAIARAVVNSPEIVLADEPTAHLDTELSKELLKILADFKKEGRTIVIATHDPLVFQAGFVDRIFDLRDGRLTGES